MTTSSSESESSEEEEEEEEEREEESGSESVSSSEGFRGKGRAAGVGFGGERVTGVGFFFAILLILGSPAKRFPTISKRCSARLGLRHEEKGTGLLTSRCHCTLLTESRAGEGKKEVEVERKIEGRNVRKSKIYYNLYTTLRSRGRLRLELTGY